MTAENQVYLFFTEELYKVGKTHEQIQTLHSQLNECPRKKKSVGLYLDFLLQLTQALKKYLKTN